MNAQELLLQIQQRKQKNLDFFQKYFPSIYASFQDKTLQNARLNIDPNTLEVNLLENDKALYPLEVQRFNKEEALDFSNTFGPEALDKPFRRSLSTEFYHGRYAHGSLAKFLERMEPIAGPVKPYCFTESLPQVAFLGCGLGLHIKALLDIRPIRHITVVENNPDHFLASLYVTDWEEIIMPYLVDKTTSFYLAISDTYIDNEETRLNLTFGSVWNHICMNVPFMPVQTLYYVHQADPFYHRVAARLNKETEPYANVWGFYDDEINQLNQVFHNIEQGIPVMKSIDLSQTDKVSIVCGNGPSIDIYMPIIKQYRDKINLIAAGSACYTLLMNDIVPDVLTTIESHYLTYRSFLDIPSEKAKQVPIIGAAQITPKTFGLFKDGLMYLKQESTYAKILDNENISIAGSPTSATNCAVAIALDNKLPNLFLIGMEFGFLDKTQTHSSSSFYYDDDNKEKWEKATQKMAKDAYKIETNERGDVYTTAFYNTARIHAQRKIQSSFRKDIINLSQGATIEGTKEWKAYEFSQYLENKEVRDTSFCMFNLLKSKSKIYSKKDLKNVKGWIHKGLSIYSQKMRKILNEMTNDLESIEKTIYKLNQYVIHNKDSETEKLVTFIRGTTWHWLYNFYGLCKEAEAKSKRETYVKEFKRQFSGFLYYLPDHYLKFISYRSENDPKLEIALENDEPNIEKWLDKIKEFNVNKSLL